MKIIVLVLGLMVIAFIGWWFFGKHDVAKVDAKVNDDRQIVDVEVKGGYSPEVVVLKKGIPATLNFTRKDSSSCLDRVVFFRTLELTKPCRKIRSRQLTLIRVTLANFSGRVGWICSTVN